MSNKTKALITGISGMDGSYLTEYLLGLGYEVHGVIRRNSVCEHQQSRLDSIRDQIVVHYGDVSDSGSLYEVFGKVRPDEIYNLAAQSHVRISFDVPQYTAQTNALGVLNVLEAYRQLCPEARFYQASSSEMFGNNKDVDGFQRETTPMHPVSPYGCAKLFGYSITRNYRNSHKLFTCNGILFNHETLTYGMPLIIKIDGKIDILPIGDIAKFRCGLSFDDNGGYQCGEPIKHIEVWDQNGWTKVKFVSGYPHKERKFPRIINARNHVYAATGSHVCIMDDRSEKTTKDMLVGDRVCLVDLPESKPSENLGLEEAEFLGMLVGDGNLHGNRPRFTNKNMDIKRRFAELWKKISGKECRFMDSNSGFTQTSVGQVECLGVAGWNFDIYTNDISPFNHKNKKVPSRVLNSSPAAMMAFLKGYNVCDGLKKNPCTYEFKNFKTNSPTLAQGLVYICSVILKQKYNITIEESWEHGKQQFYFSINLLSPNSIVQKYKEVKSLLGGNFSQREICKQSGISRGFIRKVQNGYIPTDTHRLELPKNEVKKIIDIPNYSGWFFDLETESGTFCAGIGNGVVHNSPRRGSNFVTNKIVKAAAMIHMGKQNTLELGNMDSYRDWGHSKDYVRAMHAIVNHSVADDFVVSTGQTHSVRDLCDYVFSRLDMDYKDYVVQNPKYLRPEELKYLKGDASKARRVLGWIPTYTFEAMLDEMLDFWLTQS